MRLNFNYFITDAVRDYLVEAVRLIARYGHRLLTDYVCDPHIGLWQYCQSRSPAEAAGSALVRPATGLPARSGRASPVERGGHGSDNRPGLGSGLTALLSTHPTLDQRLDQLASLSVQLGEEV